MAFAPVLATVMVLAAPVAVEVSTSSEVAPVVTTEADMLVLPVAPLIAAARSRTVQVALVLRSTAKVAAPTPRVSEPPPAKSLKPLYDTLCALATCSTKKE